MILNCFLDNNRLQNKQLIQIADRSVITPHSLRLTSRLSFEQQAQVCRSLFKEQKMTNVESVDYFKTPFFSTDLFFLTVQERRINTTWRSADGWPVSAPTPCWNTRCHYNSISSDEPWKQQDSHIKSPLLWVTEQQNTLVGQETSTLSELHHICLCFDPTFQTFLLSSHSHFGNIWLDFVAMCCNITHINKWLDLHAAALGAEHCRCSVENFFLQCVFSSSCYPPRIVGV